MYTLHDCFVTEVFVYVQATKASWEPNRSDMKNEHSEVWKLKFAHKKKTTNWLKNWKQNKTKQKRMALCSVTHKFMETIPKIDTSELNDTYEQSTNVTVDRVYGYWLISSTLIRPTTPVKTVNNL